MSELRKDDAYVCHYVTRHLRRCRDVCITTLHNLAIDVPAAMHNLKLVFRVEGSRLENVECLPEADAWAWVRGGQLRSVCQQLLAPSEASKTNADNTFSTSVLKTSQILLLWRRETSFTIINRRRSHYRSILTK